MTKPYKFAAVWGEQIQRNTEKVIGVFIWNNKKALLLKQGLVYYFFSSSTKASVWVRSLRTASLSERRLYSN